MIRFILGNHWRSLNSEPLAASMSQNFKDVMTEVGGPEYDQINSSIYAPLEELQETETTTLIGFSGNGTDYSTRRFFDSGGDFNHGNGTNTSVVFSSFGDTDIEYIFDVKEVRAIFLVLYTIVFCSCFFGNLMVILVVTLHWRMRSITNFCLANLAFADLCVGIFCVYQNIVTYLMDSWVFGEFMCKMYHFINCLSTTASVLILVVICIERYLAIIHPMTCKQMLTLNRLRITIVFVWILSAAISSPRFYYFSTISMPLPNDKYEILCLPNRTKYNSKLMDMVSMTVLFLIPLTIITILYTHIGIVLWKSSKNRMPLSTPSASISSSSSGCYYRETDQNILQAVKLTLLPVTVGSQQQQQQTHHHHSISTANVHGIHSSTPQSPLLEGCSSTQQPERFSFLSSPLNCIQCWNKSKKRQKHKRRHTTSSRKLGRMTAIQNVNGTPSPVGSRACIVNVAAMNGKAGGGGAATQELIINCKVCQHPYPHHNYCPPISSGARDNAVETTSFIQCCHNHKDNENCVTPANANNSKNIQENWQLGTRNEATHSPMIASCCSGSGGGGNGRVERPKNICFRKERSQEKSVTFQATGSPPSPFFNRNCSCVMTEGKCSKTEPIVVVKFEKKKKQSSKKGATDRKSQCTILMNIKNCHDGTTEASTCGSIGGSLDGGGDGSRDKQSPHSISPSPPKLDRAICHPPSRKDFCEENGVNGNDNNCISTGNIGIGNGALRGLHHHNHNHHHHCTSTHNHHFTKNFTVEHKRNLSLDSGISGVPTTTGRSCSIETCSCDQNVDGHYSLPAEAAANSGVCGSSCPSCGSICVDSHYQLLRCHHQNNFISGSQKLSHFSTSNDGPTIRVAVAPPSAPKRIRKMRIIRSSKYGKDALQSRRRIIRMLIVVVLAFAICHLPFHARKVWQYWSPTWAQYQAGSVFSTLLTPITFLIMYANSAINPILYAFMSKKFRMSFKDLLCCKVRHSFRINRNASMRSTHAVALSTQTTGL